MKAKGFLLLLVFVANDLWACDCKGLSVKEAIDIADIVFTGTVLSKQEVKVHSYDKSTQIKRTENGMRYKLLIEYIYKGKVSSDTISIYTGNGSADCGVFFQIGRKYIVYGRKKWYSIYLNTKNSFSTSNCARTTKFSKEEIAEIEKHLKPKRIKKITH